MEIKGYSEILNSLKGKTFHLLLGNGFSIACDPVFKYTSLYQHAEEHGLSNRLKSLFDFVGTNNFEAAMQALETGRWVVKEYAPSQVTSAEKAIKEDIRDLKKLLIEAVTERHLPFPAKISSERISKCQKFLAPFKNIFSTNYDLLAYWVTLSGSEELRCRDGFRAPIDDPDAEYLEFREHIRDQRGLLFIHGGLHLYVVGGAVLKHCWVRSDKRIIELVKESLEKGEYPLFVAEGNPTNKLEQIQRSAYLSYCFSKFQRVEAPLIILGHSLGPSDQHVCDAIAENIKLEQIFVGLHGDPESASNRAVRAAADAIQKRRKQLRAGNELKIGYFDSDSAHVWD